MRESYESDNEITKAINIDDVDTLQRILNQYKPLTNMISYDLFDSITKKEDNTFINYAASKGSIKCFKYLLLNHSELNASSFYYAVLGKNIEIIRIVDQYLNDNKIDIDYKFDYKFVLKNINFIDCNNEIRTPIIPAITLHQNDIFDWILEQKYINNGIKGNSLFDIVLVAVENGNAYAFIQCVDNGFDINSLQTSFIKDIIQLSMKNGFYKLTQFIISLLSSEILENDLHGLIEIDVSVFCGNLSILKFYLSYRKNDSDICSGLLHAVTKGYLNIVKELFKTGFANKTELEVINIVKSLVYSVQCHQTEIFVYLVNCTVFPHHLSESFLFLILNYVSYLGDFRALQAFTEFILMKKNLKSNFTKCFLCSACQNHEKNCKYLIDRKVLIDYKKLVSKGLILTCCNKEIFSMLYDSVNSEIKDTFKIQLLDDSIKNQNIELIEFLSARGSPCNNSLIEAVLTNNVDIVKIILKYNRKPSYINKLYKSGTSLNTPVVLGNFEIVKLLLSIPGIDPSLYANNNITPLVSAITSFNIDIINLILDFYGDDIESQKW